MEPSCAKEAFFCYTGLPDSACNSALTVRSSRFAFVEAFQSDKDQDSFPLFTDIISDCTLNIEDRFRMHG